MPAAARTRLYPLDRLFPTRSITYIPVGVDRLFPTRLYPRIHAGDIPVGEGAQGVARTRLAAKSMTGVTARLLDFGAAPLCAAWQP